MKKTYLFLLMLLLLAGCAGAKGSYSQLKQGFISPPDSTRGGVYWYFMDGNVSASGMTKDLEAMKAAGIGHVIYLEVNVGIPRGEVDFLSDQWKDLFAHAMSQAERLGITVTLGVGPGWTGSGGPWVKPEQSMQHLVSSSTVVQGGKQVSVKLELPSPKPPYFGMGGLTPAFEKDWGEYYEDIAVLAFPDLGGAAIDQTNEKALYYREPYSSKRGGVQQYIPTSQEYAARTDDKPVDPKSVVDLTSKMNSDGTLTWDAPKGRWKVMRFVSRNNGAVTRPAPMPGVGMESDKFDTTALNAHLTVFPGQLLGKVGKNDGKKQGGLKMLHIDSWEMGAQNWTQNLRQQFIKRRGYDPLPYYPAYDGVIVGSRETTERFLWDLRQTAQELVLENHVGHIRDYAHRHGLGLSIEPYDMNPTADLELGAVADMPMCEFWSVGYGFNTGFSLLEGSSLAHLKGQPVVPAESFTAERDGWRQHPGSMKDQSDWALAAGVNRMYYHTFAHQPLADSLRPGMTMGPYGVHWDRNQTWWYLSKDYHTYVARSQFMLQQGNTVADVLYLTPEGAPHVFRAPESAIDYKTYPDRPDLHGNPFTLPDRRGYNFDGCPPSLLYNAKVRDGKVVFEGGASYELLVLPAFKTMTPRLLSKIEELVAQGATVVGVPPVQSPSLSDYPNCDQRVQAMATKMWGGITPPATMTKSVYGAGKIFWGTELVDNADMLYPKYSVTSQILSEAGVPEDFSCSQTGVVRYTHRRTADSDIYFVANRTDQRVSVDCSFRVTGSKPEYWSPIDAKILSIDKYTQTEKITTIPLVFEPFQSCFIVFARDFKSKPLKSVNFAPTEDIQTLTAPWSVEFDPTWGGPKSVVFPTLIDWTTHPDKGIKYYSGTAFYTTKFSFDSSTRGEIMIDLGRVKNMARVSVNGKPLGTVWTSPWRVDASGAIKKGENELTVEVVNLWPNRLIGDEREGEKVAFATFKHYTADSPLLESGLIGPVKIVVRPALK